MGHVFIFINLSHSAQEWSAHNILSKALDVFFVPFAGEKVTHWYFFIIVSPFTK